jgi:uncharacterized protein (DUF2236 family)
MTDTTLGVPGDVEPDAGLLGPRSVTWQLHADPAMWLGGIRSLFLQALHPRAVAGIVQNSNFQEDPLGRLVRTANFVGLSTYGPRDQVLAAAAKIRGIHRSLRATDPRTGERFHIDDPELLLWVHCAETGSFLDVVRRAGYPLTDAQADRYLDEQRHTAALVGLQADEVPGSRAELAAYFDAMRPELARTNESDIIYRFLHWPPVPTVLRAGLPAYSTLVAHLAYSLLPNWARKLYGWPGYPGPAATVMLRTFRLGALGVPKTLLHWGNPQPHALHAVQRLGRTATPSVRRLPPA